MSKIPEMTTELIAFARKALQGDALAKSAIHVLRSLEDRGSVRPLIPDLLAFIERHTGGSYLAFPSWGRIYTPGSLLTDYIRIPGRNGATDHDGTVHRAIGVLSVTVWSQFCIGEGEHKPQIIGAHLKHRLPHPIVDVSPEILVVLSSKLINIGWNADIAAVMYRYGILGFCARCLPPDFTCLECKIRVSNPGDKLTGVLCPKCFYTLTLSTITPRPVIRQQARRLHFS